MRFSRRIKTRIIINNHGALQMFAWSTMATLLVRALCDARFFILFFFLKKSNRVWSDIWHQRNATVSVNQCFYGNPWTVWFLIKSTDVAAHLLKLSRHYQSVSLVMQSWNNMRLSSLKMVENDLLNVLLKTFPLLSIQSFVGIYLIVQIQFLLNLFSIYSI